MSTLNYKYYSINIFDMYLYMTCNSANVIIELLSDEKLCNYWTLSILTVKSIVNDNLSYPSFSHIN